MVQFSTDVRTEWEDVPGAPLDIGAFEARVRSMVRSNKRQKHSLFDFNSCVCVLNKDPYIRLPALS